jgi:hypothetical protein
MARPLDTNVWVGEPHRFSAQSLPLIFFFLTRHSRLIERSFSTCDTRRLLQAQSNCDVTSFRSKQILQNFIVETDRTTDQQTDQLTNKVSYRGATLSLKILF